MFIHNYYPEDYKASPQMFMSDEDEQGLIYFANNEGISIFDGSRWQLITLPNRSRINHLTCARSGHVYISATAELGEIVGNSEGEFSYRSFKPKMSEADRSFQEVYHCYALPKHRFFIVRDRIYCFGENEYTSFPANPAGGVRLGDRLFILQTEKPGLYELLPEGLKLFPGSDSLGVLRSLTQYSAHQVLIRRESDFLMFTPEADTDADRFTVAKGPFVEKVLNDPKMQYFSYLTPQLFTVSTQTDPLRLVDAEGKTLQNINKRSGLLSNEIHHVRHDRFGNLWVSQNRGVSYVQLSSPITHYSDLRGIDSMPLVAITHQNTVYTSTFNGIHYKTDTMSSFAHMEGTEAPCFMFCIDDRQHLFGSDGKRLLLIEKDHQREIFTAREYIYAISQSPLRKDYLFLGLDSGMVSLRVKGTGSQMKIEAHHDYTELKQAIRLILPDRNGNLWLSMEFQGLSRLDLTSSTDDDAGILQKISSPPFDREEDFYLTQHQDTLFVSSSQGFFRLDNLDEPPFGVRPLKLELQNTFGPEKRFIYDCSGKYLWIHGGQQLFRLKMNSVQELGIDKTPFAKIGTASVESIYTDSHDNSWICSNTGLFYFDASKKKDYRQSFTTRLRNVSTEKGRVLYRGLTAHLPSEPGKTHPDSQNGGDIPLTILPFHDHSLTFEYCALFYEHNRQIQYQYILEGFDKHWSNWSPGNQKEYTNLPHGQFTFKVRSRNIFGTIGSTDSFAFEIEAPWYLRFWAWLIYFFAAFLIVRILLFVYTRRLKKRQMMLETAVIERTREVEEQKRQIAEKNRILNELATKDDLTGIANHRRIMEYYRSEWQRAQREQTSIGVLLADIDNFKDYNDHFGHLQGDRCLLKVAQAFDSCALRPADMAGRYGGEEFLMILPQTSPEGIMTVAENILQAVRDLNIRQSDEHQGKLVTISIGVVSAIPRTDMNPQLLLILADQALYRSKGQGKDRVTLAQQYGET